MTNKDIFQEVLIAQAIFERIQTELHKRLNDEEENKIYYDLCEYASEILGQIECMSDVIEELQYNRYDSKGNVVKNADAWRYSGVY